VIDDASKKKITQQEAILIIDDLIKNGVSIDAKKVSYENQETDTPLMYAIQFKLQVIANYLIKKEANVNLINAQTNESAISLAIQNWQFDVAIELILRDTNLSLTLNDGRTIYDLMVNRYDWFVDKKKELNDKMQGKIRSLNEAKISLKDDVEQYNKNSSAKLNTEIQELSRLHNTIVDDIKLIESEITELDSQIKKFMEVLLILNGKREDIEINANKYHDTNIRFCLLSNTNSELIKSELQRNVKIAPNIAFDILVHKKEKIKNLTEFITKENFEKEEQFNDFVEAKKFLDLIVSGKKIGKEENSEIKVCNILNNSFCERLNEFVKEENFVSTQNFQDFKNFIYQKHNDPNVKFELSIGGIVVGQNINQLG
jgi:hypothetical protein